MKVIRRDGTIQDFSIDKIENVVNLAFRSCGREKAPQTLLKSFRKLFKGYPAGRRFRVEELQDIVEKHLMRCGYYEVAKEYIIYRNSHSEIRYIEERVRYMDEYAKSGENAASASETDGNANVAIKNVANLDGEVYKTLNRSIQRHRMVKKLKDLFPDVAGQYVRDIESHVIYVHDEASSPAVKNYCEAVSLWPFLLEGTAGMDGLKASAPNNLNGFCGQFNNLVFLLTAQCKGAVAFGEFFNVFDYYCVRTFGADYHRRMDEPGSLYPAKTIRGVIRQCFQNIVYTINQPAGNRSYQSPFTNISYYDSNYWHALFKDVTYPDGTQLCWERVSLLQKEFMHWFNEERTRTLLTFPVETMALMTDGRDVLDKEYKDLTAEMYSLGHSFFTYLSDNPDALASCCRLRSRIRDNVFSFTNGLTGVQTGSANVITLNLNRITQNWARENGYDRDYLSEHFFEHEDSFVEYISAILDRVYKYHTAYKTLLYETEEAGMLNASTSGYISMHRLYSTIGENGINEAAEFVGLKCSYNEGYKRFCRLVTGTISRLNRERSSNDFMFNQEFVPAEGLSSKNRNWDKEDGYWVPEGRILYNSYFYLADDPGTSVLDKFRLHGREFTELLDGGVGLHCNLSEHLSKEQYLKLIDFAIANGTSYFTFNVPNSECTNPECKHIVKVPMDICPKCGSRMRQWTRVIGFLRPVEDFDKFRHAEAKTRYYAGKDSLESALTH